MTTSPDSFVTDLTAREFASLHLLCALVARSNMDQRLNGKANAHAAVRLADHWLEALNSTLPDQVATEPLPQTAALQPGSRPSIPAVVSRAQRDVPMRSSDSRTSVPATQAGNAQRTPPARETHSDTTA